jgi:hypothetical protein
LSSSCRHGVSAMTKITVSMKTEGEEIDDEKAYQIK